MSWSSTKRLFNEITEFEKNSSIFIENEMLYIVKISLDHPESLDIMNYISEELLNSSPNPVALYHSSREILLIFNKTEEEHQQEGNHHLIISKYCSKILNILNTKYVLDCFSTNIENNISINDTLTNNNQSANNISTSNMLINDTLKLLIQSKHDNNVKCTIIEFETKLQLVTYLSCAIINTASEYMQQLSSKIDFELFNFRTETELINMLSKEGIDWHSLNNINKYGRIIKLRSKKDKGVFIDEISEKFDGREYQKYISFIF